MKTATAVTAFLAAALAAGPAAARGNPAPTGLFPSSATAGSGAFLLLVQGAGFAPGAVVRWNGSARATTFLGSSELEAAIGSADIAAGGSASVSVCEPGKRRASRALVFTINNPAPDMSGLAPGSTTVGGPSFTLSVLGDEFVPGSAVRFNGSPEPTRYVNASQLTATIPASAIASTGTAAVTISNPGPGGGRSTLAFFAIKPVARRAGRSPVPPRPDAYPDPDDDFARMITFAPLSSASTDAMSACTR